MKNVILKESSPEEIKAKMIVLEASGKFPKGLLKLLEEGKLKGQTLQFEDAQVEILQSLQLVQDSTSVEVKKVPRINIQNRDSNVKEQRIPSEGKQVLEQQEVENADVIVETESVEESRETTAQNEELDVEIQVSTDENQDEQNVSEKEENEEKKEKEFMPKSPEDLKNMPPEEVKKMFYLTPERMIESIKRINNGEAWNRLAQSSQDKLMLQTAIEKAYESCVYPGDLTDPNFLDERIGQYLPADNQAIQLKELHMAALMNTYVGYHVEKNDGDVKNINSRGEEQSQVAIVKFPTLVSEMPEVFKEQTRKELVKAIEKRVEDIVNTNNSYKALMMLVPMEHTIDDTLEDYTEGLHDTEEKKAVNAYIKTVRTDVKEEMRVSFRDLNVSMDLQDIDWNKADERKAALELIRKLQGDGRESAIPSMIDKINISFDINSPEDINALRAACEDFSDLSEQGINVKISFDIPPKDAMNPALQQELDNVVDDYDNVSRDTKTEAINHGIDAMIGKGVNSALGVMPVMTPLQERDVLEASLNDVSENKKEDILMAISLGATTMEVEHMISEAELEEEFPRLGGGEES